MQAGGGGIADAIAQIRFVLQSDPSAGNEQKRAIMEKFEEEIARLTTAERAAAASSVAAAGASVPLPPAAAAPYGHFEGDRSSAAAPSTAPYAEDHHEYTGPKVERRKGIQPVDVWKAEHEEDRAAKQVRASRWLEGFSSVGRDLVNRRFNVSPLSCSYTFLFPPLLFSVLPFLDNSRCTLVFSPPPSILFVDTLAARFPRNHRSNAAFPPLPLRS